MKTLILTISALMLSLTAGASCPDTGHEAPLCLAYQAVIFVNDDKPMVKEEGVKEALNKVNEIWKRCGIGFDYEGANFADASDTTLVFHPRHDSDLHVNYEKFNDPRFITMIFTGTFKDLFANYTGYAVYPWRPHPGHASVPATNFRLVPRNLAHELGHVMGLEHVKDGKHLMNEDPTPRGRGNPLIEDSECETVRKYATTVLKEALK